MTDWTRLNFIVDNIRLIPYIQMYEFEALLYSEVSTLDETMQIYSFKSKLNELNDIINSFLTPEEINNNPNTAPSKRLLNLYVRGLSFLNKNLNLERI